MSNKLATKADLKEMYDRMLPYLGGMPEMLANKFSKGDLYSTDEKMIGQWIDGRPLYQKSYEITSPSTTSDTLVIPLPNDYKVVDFEGYINQSPYNYMPLPFYYNVASAACVYYQYNPNPGLRMLVVSDLTSKEVVLTIRYIKTTDSAISIGSDTDYSTDEKIVGTWIDGKPIWQKTLNNITVPKNSTSALIENVDLLVDCKLSYVRDGVRTTSQSFYNSASDMVLVIPAVNESTHSFYIYWKSPYTLSDFNITLQYTKTTS